MKNITISLMVLVLAMTINCKRIKETPVLERNFHRSLISRGDNIPDFSIKKDSADFLLVYLHENKSLSEFKKDTRQDDETVNKTIELLKSKNWLTEKNGKLRPSVCIITAKDSEKLYNYAQPISLQITDEIEKVLPTVKAEFAKTKIAESKDFEYWSFLILSNVLLDNRQIFEMEKNFFKQPDGKEYDRPLRYGKHYYASIQKSTEESREGFGIYGNAVMYYSDWNAALTIKFRYGRLKCYIDNNTSF
jgi:hypothetical protein